METWQTQVNLYEELEAKLPFSKVLIISALMNALLFSGFSRRENAADA